MTVEALKPDALYRRVDPALLDFETTSELADLGEPLGQARAVTAIEFGIGMRKDGYNVYALGPTHTGRYRTIRGLVERRARTEATPPDWCYVNNFDEAHLPKALELPAGYGVKLRHGMESLVDDLKNTLPAVFESDDYRARRQVVDEEFRERQERAFEELQEKAQARGIALLRTPTGLALAPTKNGEVVKPEVFEKLPQAERAVIEKDIEELQKQLQETMHAVPQWEKERRNKVRELNQQVTHFTVEHLIADLRQTFKDFPEVIAYFAAVQKDIIDNADSFMPGREDGTPTIFGLPIPQQQQGGAPLRRYQVNVVVDNSSCEGAPIVTEDLPTHGNLVGRVEHIAEMGALVTDFGLIKPGALHKANGGYLILDARKLLLQSFSWEALKRALRGRQIRIESLGQLFSAVSTVSLQPEPIPLDVKVVLIGDRMLYYMLSQYDPEFDDLFKVAADFEEDVPRGPRSMKLYARLIATLARSSELRPFDRSAVARVIEHAARLAGDSEKLSTQVDRVHDLLREADYFAGEAKREAVSAADVQRAIDAQIHRSDRMRERGLEMITRGTVLIDTEGAQVGQVNALSVIGLGNYSFGRPSRITARVRLGRGEVVDIERKVELGGPLHSKGVFILEGFLGARFAIDHPLSLSASLVFEQSYGGVDGDSASSTELYALLSALAEAPIRQSLSVTGSVNQHGEVQAIGGVNQKIEGFFDLCAARGLTGEQGVLIPATNAKDLMLKEAVVDAVAAGKFHIYPVRTIDQGIAILTGMAAGERGADGAFPEDTINRRVEDRLIALAEKRRSFGEAQKQGNNTES